MTATDALSRTHDALRREATRDPIFLLQERVPVWSPTAASPAYDHGAEAFVDDDGKELTTEQAIDAGAGSWAWRTLTVFLTRYEGESWATARAYRYEHGWRVYCVAAEGDLCGVLASATIGGRYS
jgi:hypothetical protein